MLNAKNRIKKRKEFGYIYKHGTTLYSKNLVVMFTSNKFKKVRVGFSISKKVGKAYIRNKVKRQLRAIIRTNIDKMTTSTNYVIIAKPSIVELTYDQMEKECLYVLGKILKDEKQC